MAKLIALLKLFRVGGVVADPAKWKKRQITATMLVPVIGAAIDLSRLYGYNVPLDHDSIVTLSVSIVVVVNVVITVISSATIGFRAANGTGVDEGTTSGPTS